MPKLLLVKTKISQLLFVLLLVFPLTGFRYTGLAAQGAVSDPLFMMVETPWADSVFTTLTDEEKIAQLFMVAAYSNKGEKHKEELLELIEKYHIGGLIFFQGGPARQAALTNEFQAASKTPLFIAIDGEWGLAMRLDSTVKYPWQMTLGAIQNNELIYRMGNDIGEQLNRLGVHINFAPVVDVNVNPKNPVINARSFGESRENVAEKGIAYMKGMQHKRVLANAKHFPGHGDTDKDSHKTLPVISHTRSRLDSVELYPFKRLIENGLSSVMVAHLYVPAYVKTYNEATTLSKEVVTDLLKDTLGFSGLTFTDALNMKGVSSRYAPGEVDRKALLAGNDVLLFAQDVPKAIDEIKKSIRKGEIDMEEIDARCLKILRAKEWAGLSRMRPIEMQNLVADLNKPAYEALNRELTASSLTLLTNKNDLLPLGMLDTLRIASIHIGEDSGTAFKEALARYADVDHFNLSEDANPLVKKELLDKLAAYNLVIVGIHKSNASPFKSYQIKSSAIDFLNVLRLRKKVVLSVFTNPYSLVDFSGADHFDALIMAYQNSVAAQELTAEVIFGGSSARGRLPVSVSPSMPIGSGLSTPERVRLNYVMPEDLGIESSSLAMIDSLALKGIAEKAYPGCQVLVAKGGKVFYNKAFGYHTYDSTRAVKTSDVYDLASITKIASTLLAVMKLTEEGEIDLDGYLCEYLPHWVDTSEYANITLREMLAHQAGLTPWIAFYKHAMHKGMPRYDIFSLANSSIYPDRVAERLYINRSYRDSMIAIILGTKLNEKREYRYSDIGYYFLKEIVEQKTGQPLNEYVDEHFYKPMGMSTLGYLPRQRIALDRIIPTENDKVFRKQLIHGDVHDPGAAMMGGVGGHAGLFSSANDLAKLMQMYLNGGMYGGKQYLSDSIVNAFTACQYCEDDNRRGAGFDKPVRDGGSGPTCNCVSFASFGHSGFTGTIAWADPEEEIVYIFLSNRVYPDASNKKLIEMGIRTRIQEEIYRAIGAGANKKEYVEHTENEL
jgi:beta-glucosidase-like glycosyl hydrolase/CubicO group peptidase (beta-lactamase class C family)